MSSIKKCFVISPIGSKNTKVRENANNLLNDIIKPVTQKCGYVTKRVDELNTSGKITIHIIKEIVNSDLVIADLTGLNANVFYELGVCHTVDKHTILMKNVSDKKNYHSHSRTLYNFL